ncbi:hypothetical protein [Nocardia mangyaensis]|uniref:hypothetical protein n=1 Tax=Nocardia mangyaensis TaxID=2213200 RepID=UPI000AC56D45
MVVVPFRHTAPSSAGRPSGMRSDRHESRPTTLAAPYPVSVAPAGPTPPADATASTYPAHAQQLPAPLTQPRPPRHSLEATAVRAARTATAPAGVIRVSAALVASADAATDAVATHTDGTAAHTATTPAEARTWRRRTLLRLVGAGALGAPAVAVLAACAEDDTVHAPDPLAAQEVLARADAVAATAAIALAPQSQAALSTIATERTAHADALRAEIDRVLGVYGDGTTPVRRTGEVVVPGPDGSTVPASVVETHAAQPLDLAQLRDQLARSQQAAARAASTESGYRAGLLASISASCATQAGVLLT